MPLPSYGHAFSESSSHPSTPGQRSTAMLYVDPNSLLHRGFSQTGAPDTRTHDFDAPLFPDGTALPPDVCSLLGFPNGTISRGLNISLSMLEHIRRQKHGPSPEEERRMRQEQEERERIQRECDQRERHTEEERMKREHMERQRQEEERAWRQAEEERMKRAERQEEEERIQREDTERVRREEEKRQRQAEEERILRKQLEREKAAKAEEETAKREQEQQDRAAEEERIRRQAEVRRKEEEERKRQVEEERSRRQTEVRRKEREEEERKKQVEEEKIRAEARAERMQREEGERKRQEEEEKMAGERKEQERVAAEKRLREAGEKQAEEERRRAEEQKEKSKEREFQAKVAALPKPEKWKRDAIRLFRTVDTVEEGMQPSQFFVKVGQGSAAIVDLVPVVVKRLEAQVSAKMAAQLLEKAKGDVTKAEKMGRFGLEHTKAVAEVVQRVGSNAGSVAGTSVSTVLEECCYDTETAVAKFEAGLVKRSAGRSSS